MTKYIIKDSSGQTVVQTLDAQRAHQHLANRPDCKLIKIPEAR